MLYGYGAITTDCTDQGSRSLFGATTSVAIAPLIEELLVLATTSVVIAKASLIEELLVLVTTSVVIVKVWCISTGLHLSNY